MDTFDRLEVAEFIAKSTIMGTSPGNLVPMSSMQVEELRRKYFLENIATGG